MIKYAVLECKDCKRKEIYPSHTADGYRCKQCGSGLLIHIDEGKRQEMELKHIPPVGKNAF